MGWDGCRLASDGNIRINNGKRVILMTAILNLVTFTALFYVAVIFINEIRKD